jgi:malate dehydrogenase
MVKAVVAGAAGPSSSLHAERNVADTRFPGGIGQPLSLLLKLNPLITELSLYDVVNAPGVSTAVERPLPLPAADGDFESPLPHAAARYRGPADSQKHPELTATD